MKDVIDVSHHNGVIDWEKVKGNCSCAIIRLGYRSYTAKGGLVRDKQFCNNITGAISQNIPVAVYYFPTEITADECRETGEWIKEQLKPYGNFVSVVWLDSELSTPNGAGRSDNLDPLARTAMLNRLFTEITKDHKYDCGLYCSDSWLIYNLSKSMLAFEQFWIARYNKQPPKNCKDWLFWQYTSYGLVPGIVGNVDLSMPNPKYFKV